MPSYFPRASMEGVMPKLRRVFFLIVVAALGVGLAACANTIRGVGRDLHQTGNAIGDAVEGR